MIGIFDSGLGGLTARTEFWGQLGSTFEIGY